MCRDHRTAAPAGQSAQHQVALQLQPPARTDSLKTTEQGQNLPPDWGRTCKQASCVVLCPQAGRPAGSSLALRWARPCQRHHHPLLPPSDQGAELVFPGQGAAPKPRTWGTAQAPSQVAILMKPEVDNGPKRGPVRTRDRTQVFK